MLVHLKRNLFLAAAAIVWLTEANGLDVPENGIFLKYGKRDENFDNRIGKSALFKMNDGRSLLYCAGMCQRDGSCVSFFYNKKTKECQGQGTNLDDHTHVHDSPGTKYYKMYQRNSKNIRTTPKLIEKFNDVAFMIPDVNLEEISNVDICLKKCQDEFPKCITINYSNIFKRCDLFEMIHTKPTAGYRSPGSVYYRAARSFCAEDEEYLYVPEGKICLKYFSEKVSWKEADLACKAEGAHLADVQAKNMKVALEMFLKVQNNNDYSTAHIGIKDEKNDGIYVDRKDNPFDQSIPRFPLKDYKAKNCVNVKCRFSCRWHVVDCDTFISGFLCEK